jgi:hypothetical protein
MATTEHTGILKYVDDDGNVNILYPEIGKTISKADFDALSEEEKNTGVYWVTDGAGGTGGNNIDIVDNLESTDTDKALSANQCNVIKNMLGDQVTFSLSGTTLTITTK